MLRHYAKLPVNATDVWGVVTLAVFIGLILTLAIKTSASAERGNGLTISSNGPVAPGSSNRL